MNGSADHLLQQSKHAPPQDLQPSSDSGTQTFQEVNLEQESPQTPQETEHDSAEAVTEDNAEPEDKGIRVSELINDEVIDLLFRVESILEKSLASAKMCYEKQKTEKYLLNLCSFVTRSHELKERALNWVTQYARWSIGMTLNEIYEEDPLLIPVPLVTYLLEESGALTWKNKIPISTDHYSPVSNGSDPETPPPENNAQSVYLPVSDESRSETPDDLPPLLDATDYAPPEVAALTLLIQRSLNKACNDAATQSDELVEPTTQAEDATPDEACAPKMKQKTHELTPRILFETASASDWKQMEKWVDHFTGSADLDDDAIIWIATHIASNYKTMKGL